MTDRPIIFSAPMVRALLDGRKTQTRRVPRPQPTYRDDVPTKLVWQVRKDRGIFNFDDDQFRRHAPLLCPYAIGDRLWVRENWQALSHGDYLPTKAAPPYCDLRYAATDALADLTSDVRGYPWRPSIHMPRWASRLTLTVTDVRVQRLQDISEDDAVDEGVTVGGEQMPADHFRDLWNSLYGPDAWDANPWVVALTFTVQRCNIDEVPKHERGARQ